MPRLMQPSTKRAGGCLLVGGILIGLVVGLFAGNAMLGVWLGTGIGIVAAVAVWLIDRRGD